MSWNPAIATIKYSNLIYGSVWSPCSRFIAVTGQDFEGIQILDAATLKKLKSFTLPHGPTELFAFSPESHFLTCANIERKILVSWDVQTGAPISETPVEERPDRWAFSITHSECGKMFGVVFKSTISTNINTYDILSGALICCHPVQGTVRGIPWTHGGYLKFATLDTKSITVWQVGFTSKFPPTEVESLPLPHNFNPSRGFLFLPTLSRFAFALEETVLVWDAHHSKFLLHFAEIEEPWVMSFSSDGHFFACQNRGPEIYLWKEYPTGYVLHQKLVSSSERVRPKIQLLSPNGRLIIVSDGFDRLQLWYTADSTTSPSSIPTQTLQYNYDHCFVLGFSSDGSLAVSGQVKSSTATVLNLKSGLPLLIIDTGMAIYGLGISGSTIGVVGNEKVIIWNLPTGDCIPNVRVNVNDSVQTTMLNHPAPEKSLYACFASVSPDFSLVAITEPAKGIHTFVNIYDMHTGGYLADCGSGFGSIPWFTQDGCEVWCYHRGWAIIRDSESNATKLECLDPVRGPSGGWLWDSPHGFQVIDDGWIVSSSGKPLLWVPHHWRSNELARIWSGWFLALVHAGLSEAVIIELPEE